MRAATQFRSDNLDWKTGYSVSHKSDAFDLLGYASVQRRGMGYDGRGRRLGKRRLAVPAGTCDGETQAGSHARTARENGMLDGSKATMG